VKRVAILGATGTLGQELIRQILKSHPTTEIVGISRCELKQKETLSRFKFAKNIRMHLGDIRDEDRILRLMKGCDTVFHVAALKHIDTMEDNPEESVKTNIIGTIHACNAAERAGVNHFVFSSTDKAVDPINVYGMCKGISERIVFCRNEEHAKTKFRVYRWGNVLFSRGSALHYFAEAIRSGEPVKLTHPEMTRFWIRIEDAVSYMLSTYETGYSNRPMIPEMKASSVEDVIASVARIVRRQTSVTITGPRSGEKLHEVLLSKHEQEGGLASNTAPKYTESELDDLLRPFIEVTH
jgi:UDP-N-acetylglucosamine 4,6-dehydratase